MKTTLLFRDNKKNPEWLMALAVAMRLRALLMTTMALSVPAPNFVSTARPHTFRALPGHAYDAWGRWRN